MNAREEKPETKTQEFQNKTSTSSISTYVNNAETKLNGQKSCIGVKPKVVTKTSQKTCNNYSVKLSTIAPEAIPQAKIYSSNQNSLPISQKNTDVEKLVVQLIRLLNNWDNNVSVLVTQAGKPEKPDSHEVENLSEKPSILLATRLTTTNVGKLN